MPQPSQVSETAEWDAATGVAIVFTTRWGGMADVGGEEEGFTTRWGGMADVGGEEEGLVGDGCTHVGVALLPEAAFLLSSFSMKSCCR